MFSIFGSASVDPFYFPESRRITTLRSFRVSEVLRVLRVSKVSRVLNVSRDGNKYKGKYKKPKIEKVNKN